jgi:hypothetical protein
MSAHTLVTCVKGPSAPGGDGTTWAYGTFTGSAAYDAGGSILDLSSYFSNTVVALFATPRGDATLNAKWVPGASYGSSLNKVFLDDNAGTEETLDHSGTTLDFLAIGTDA